jgi:hypothetical protein
LFFIASPEGGSPVRHSTHGDYLRAISLHYQKQKDQFLDLQRDEQDPNVLRWLTEMIDVLDNELKRSKIEEEMRGF